METWSFRPLANGNFAAIPVLYTSRRDSITQVKQLSNKFPDFRRAYSEDGIAPEEFDTFAPTVRTLRQFIEACHELDARVRDLMLPNPDLALS